MVHSGSFKHADRVVNVLAHCVAERLLWFTFAGSSVRASLTSVTSPEIGEYTSLAACIDRLSERRLDCKRSVPHGFPCCLAYLHRLDHTKGFARADCGSHLRQLNVHNVPQLFLIQADFSAVATFRALAPPIEQASRTCAKSEMPTVATSPSCLTHSWLFAYFISDITAQEGRGLAGKFDPAKSCSEANYNA